MRGAIAILLLAAVSALGQGVNGSGIYPQTLDGSVVTGIVTPANGGVGNNTGAPQSLRYLGTGSDGASNCSGTLGAGEYSYSSFTVSNGNTCTWGGTRYATIIRSTGACTIAGTMNWRGQDLGISFQGDAGGSGGGGGGGTAAGAAGSASQVSSFFQSSWASAGTAGASSGGAGGSGNSPTTPVQKLALSTGNVMRGGSQGGAGGTGSAAGGNGGGTLILACASINFTGTINANGANGTASAANNNGGGGGGGGGVVILSTPTYTANTGTINVAGGSGGGCGAFTGCGAGGSGGNGWSIALTAQ